MNAYSIDSAWTKPAAEVVRILGVDLTEGLSEQEATRRRASVGPNLLREPPGISWWLILASQLKSLVVALLGIAALVSFAFGEVIEGAAVIAVLAINTTLGFVAELRAARSMQALRRLGGEKARIRRGGQDKLLPVERIVPGDVVLFEGGDRIPADLRVVEVAQLETDESILTGESLPVAKDCTPHPADTPLHARASMLFKGTTVTHGAGVGVVVATGMSTELGRVAELVASAEDEVTPLEERLDELGRRLIVATLFIAIGAAVVGAAAGKDTLLMVQTAIALAVAAIPEGLPIVATIALARGMWRMARRNALINRLSAVETLGATTLILTDKTGTLTENRLAVRRVITSAGTHELDGRTVDVSREPLLAKSLRIAAFCNDASIRRRSGRIEGTGDPLEVALLEAAALAGIERNELLAECPEEREEAFDAALRMMATFHRVGDEIHVAVKGAAEPLLEHADAILEAAGARAITDDDRRAWDATNDALAAQGFRVLGLATKKAATLDEDPYEGLTFVGLVALIDPPRREATRALAACRAAGIRVVMVTGDQASTAAFVAAAVGMTGNDAATAVVGTDIAAEGSLDHLRETDIFARVGPEQKLRLIAMHQEAGEVVAMTGDGVNDAPALKKADIGIAMGLRGTQVAQEAADMVLTDDAFGSIVAAVHQGRVIFGNIRKFVLYLMSCNVSEIFIVTGAIGLDLPLPLLPLQILFLNLVTDVFPALALALGEGNPRLMDAPPRDPSEPILTRSHWMSIAAYGLVITISVLIALGMAISWLGFSAAEAVTVSFATLALAQLWHVFNLRDRGSSLLRNDIVGNPWVWGALALCVALIGAAVHLPGLNTVLHTTNPGPSGWLLILGMSLVPWLVGQVWAGRPAAS